MAGHNLRTRPEEVRRRIGVVGHRSLLYDDLTCRENLIYYGRLYGLKDHTPRVDEVLEKVRLGSRADHRVRPATATEPSPAANSQSSLLFKGPLSRIPVVQNSPERPHETPIGNHLKPSGNRRSPRSF